MIKSNYKKLFQHRCKKEDGSEDGESTGKMREYAEDEELAGEYSEDEELE